MAKERRIVERQNGEPVRMHIINASDRNDYREAISFQTFDETMDRMVVEVGGELDFQPLVSRRDWTHPDYENLPQTQHGTLWAFYTHINWDYKRKRFNR